MQKKINIAMAWWWTWWHVLPIKSLIQHIYKSESYSKQTWDIFWFWSNKSFEKESFKELYHEYSDLQNLFFIDIFSGKYRRQKTFEALIKNIIDIFLFLIWIFQSIFYLYKHNIDVIFCKWGYVALPVTIAWFLMRKKVIVHESDIKPWLVNKISSKFAEKIFSWFNDTLEKSQTVWQILSDDVIFNPIQDKYQIIKTPWTKKTRILLTWWSQWARKLYQSFISALKRIWPDSENYEIFVILWKKNIELRQEFQQFKNIKILDFVSQKEMWELLYFCDIAITRAGTTSLAEQKLYDLKLIMVPIPRTHDQYDNAKFYEKNYSDILIDSSLENYDTKFKNTLKENINFKKAYQQKDISKSISKAKDIIIASLFESDSKIS